MLTALESRNAPLPLLEQLPTWLWASGCVLALGLLFFVLTDIFGYAYTALLCMMALVHLLVSAMYSFVPCSFYAAC